MSYNKNTFTVDSKLNSNIPSDNADIQSYDNSNYKSNTPSNDIQFKTDFNDPDIPFKPEPVNSNTFYNFMIEIWNLSIKYMYYIIIFYIIFYSILFYFFFDDMMNFLFKFYQFLIISLNYLFAVTVGSFYKTYTNIQSLFTQNNNKSSNNKSSTNSTSDTPTKPIINDKLKNDINKTKQKINDILADESDSSTQKITGYCYIGNESGTRKCAPITNNTCMSQLIFKNLSDCISNN